MPSPFPGMDPYLEGELWNNFHTQLAVEIARQLSPRLRPRYLALTEKRFVMAMPENEDGIAVATVDIRPDVGVAEIAFPVPGEQGSAPSVATSPLRLTTVMPIPVPLVTVEIRDVENRQLVTMIEVLSPTNKRGDGRLEYLTKRQRALLSTAHLIEIDLLRTGRRVPMHQPLPAAPYFIYVGRAEARPVTDIWPVQLDEPLPKVPVPLLPGDADVQLDLQEALRSIYDGFSYDLAIDYHREPQVPLSADGAAWARERLRAWQANR